MSTSKQAIKEWLVGQVADLAGCSAETIDTEARFTSFGLDSLLIEGLCHDMAEWLGRSVEDGIFWEFQTIDALSGHLAEEPEADTAEEETARCTQPRAATEPSSR